MSLLKNGKRLNREGVKMVEGGLRNLQIMLKIYNKISVNGEINSINSLNLCK